MDQNVIEQIKQDLLTRKSQVEEELSQITRSKDGGSVEAAFPEYGSKSDENAKEIDEYTTNLATEKVLEDTLRDIESALGRIAKGNYGICKYCGQEMDEKRLLARPVASACVECKTKLQNS